MSLIDVMSEACERMAKAKQADGEGGYSVTWTAAGTFDAMITIDSSTQAEIAKKQGLTSSYTVTVSRGVQLAFHDVIRRVRDGKVFRVTTNGGEIMTPATSDLDVMQVKAEGWELT